MKCVDMVQAISPVVVMDYCIVWQWVPKGHGSLTYILYVYSIVLILCYSCTAWCKHCIDNC